MRKRTWFKTVGVLAFGAQLLGGAAMVRADNACFPMPTFANGGDPPFDKLDFPSQSHWTGSSGFGWSAGSASEMSYEAAMGTNPSPHDDVTGKQLVFALTRNVGMPIVGYWEGMRLGFTYDYDDSKLIPPPQHPNGMGHVSQIVYFTFDDGSKTGPWPKDNKPAKCSSLTATTVTVPCWNDAKADPATWSNLKPTNINIVQEIAYDSATATPVPPQQWAGADTTWVKEHSRVWIINDTATNLYTWRVQIAVPIRNLTGAPAGAIGPDPTKPWTSEGVFIDPSAFNASGTKNKPPFWLDMISGGADISGAQELHFPDYSTTADGRDGNQFRIPSTSLWGTGEVGSPRDVAVTSGDIPCTASGLLIQTSTNDHVVWHSNVWNETPQTTGGPSIPDNGKLYMLDASNKAAVNQIAVSIENNTSSSVDPRNVKAHFFVAPFGSQAIVDAIGSVWAPLSTGGNDYTCSGDTTANHKTCTPVPVGANNLIDSQPNPSTQTSVSAGQPFTIEQQGGWTPSANYICATQTTDAPKYSWYYESNQGGQGALCNNAVYQPDDRLGANPAEAGLPAHACMQVQLSATGVQLETKSAFRNMHQETASLARDTATIDTRGLKKVPGQSYHDIYLYVETKKMPYRVDAGYAPTTYTQAMKTYASEYSCRYDVDGGFYCPPGQVPNIPAPSDNFFIKFMPTFIVHAYADTGSSYMVGTHKIPVLTRMTDFGEFVSHDSTVEGPVYGWDASLEPLSKSGFQKIGVNTYRLRIPNDGQGQVVTHVEPLPTKRPVCSGTVDMNIVQLLNSIAPIVQVSPECAGEINGLIDSLQIECIDLDHFLKKILALDWGSWNSWIKFLVQQVEASSGCQCN